MERINTVRVLMGGLVAAVILNVGEIVLNELLLKKQWEMTLKTLGVGSVQVTTIVLFVAMNIVLGIAIVWLYAAVRPRLGAGPRTALVVGLIGWFFVWLMGFGGTWLIGLYPTSLVLPILGWGLFEMSATALAGSWMYKEA